MYAGPRAEHYTARQRGRHSEPRNSSARGQRWRMPSQPGARPRGPRRPPAPFYQCASSSTSAPILSTIAPTAPAARASTIPTPSSAPPVPIAAAIELIASLRWWYALAMSAREPVRAPTAWVTRKRASFERIERRATQSAAAFHTLPTLTAAGTAKLPAQKCERTAMLEETSMAMPVAPTAKARARADTAQRIERGVACGVRTVRVALWRTHRRDPQGAHPVQHARASCDQAEAIRHQVRRRVVRVSDQAGRARERSNDELEARENHIGRCTQCSYAARR
eukprot:5814753-Prymnesium_polylepis.2